MFEWLAVFGMVNRRKCMLPVEDDRRKRMSRKQASEHLNAAVDRLERVVQEKLGEKK